MKSTHDYMIHNGIVHNGGGKRAGSFAMYMEPWHSVDIESFLDMKKIMATKKDALEIYFTHYGCLIYL